MPDRLGYRVEGLAQVTRALRALGVDVEDLKDAFSALATLGAGYAAAAAPKHTGRLAADIRGNRAASKAVITAGRASIRYAGPINYGWPARNIAPSGFMQTADERLRPAALQILEAEINNRITKRGLS